LIFFSVFLKEFLELILSCDNSIFYNYTHNLFLTLSVQLILLYLFAKLVDLKYQVIVRNVFTFKYHSSWKRRKYS